mgnify:CR=1 FL=1
MIDKRLMYAQGQRVAKTMDGSRPGYRGSDYGDEARGTGAYSGGNDNNQSNNTPETTRPNPHTDSGTSKTSVVSGDRMRSSAREFVQDINHNRAIEAAKTKTKFTPYGGGSKNFKESFFDTGPGKFIKGIGTTALMMYAPQILGPKFATGMKAYKTAKTVKNFLDKTDVTTSLTNLFSGDKKPTSKSKKSISKTGTGGIKFGGEGGEGGNGIAGLEAISSLENEYILLLQKLQAGSISENDKSRFGVLKQMLGK